MDPDIDWPTPQGLLGDESYRGHSGVRRSVSSLGDAWEHLEARPSEFFAAGGCVLAVVELTAKGRRSGIELSEERGHLWTFREGKAAKMEIFFDREEALRALRARCGDEPIRRLDPPGDDV